MANIKIILAVDTNGLAEQVELMKQGKVKEIDVNKYCKLYDNTADMPSFNPENYVTSVMAGQSIEWSGTPQDPGTCDCVSIDSIVFQIDNENFYLFGVPILIGRDGEITGSVVAQSRQGEEEEYTINFSVIRNSDGSNGSYHIDPKILVNT